MSYSSNYLGIRFPSIPSENGIATFADAYKRLGISRRTAFNWLSDPEFIAAKVAFSKIHGESVRWYVHIERLKHWLVYIGAIKPRPSKRGEVAQNPPEKAGDFRRRKREEAKRALFGARPA